MITYMDHMTSFCHHIITYMYCDHITSLHHVIFM